MNLLHKILGTYFTPYKSRIYLISNPSPLAPRDSHPSNSCTRPTPTRAVSTARYITLNRCHTTVPEFIGSSCSYSASKSPTHVSFPRYVHRVYNGCGVLTACPLTSIYVPLHFLSGPRASNAILRRSPHHVSHSTDFASALSARGPNTSSVPLSVLISPTNGSFLTLPMNLHASIYLYTRYVSRPTKSVVIYHTATTNLQLPAPWIASHRT